MIAAFRSELFRLRKRAMPWILLGVLCGVIAVLYGLYLFLVRSGASGLDEATIADFREGLRPNSIPDWGMLLVQQYGTVLLVILAATLIANEYGWGTIRTTLPRTSGRAAFLTAKLVTLLLATVIAVVVGFIVAIPATIVASSVEGLDRGLDSGFAGASVAAIGRTAFVLLPYVALAAMTALLTRSSGVGIGVGLALLFLEPVIVILVQAMGSGGDTVSQLMLSPNVDSLLSRNAPGESTAVADATGRPGAWQAAATLGAYLAASIGLAYWRLLRRDITL